MAIAMAQHGGIGIIHRYQSIQDQVAMVQKVKRSESYIIRDPYTTTLLDTIASLKHKSVHTFLIVSPTNDLLGIITTRDMLAAQPNALVQDHATLINLITLMESQSLPPPSLQVAKQIMLANRIEKLPVVDQHNKIKGLICLKDILRIESRPNATLDSLGRLRCGAAIGVKDPLDRAIQLINAGCDVLVIDIAHGDSDIVVQTIKQLKHIHPTTDIIAGNIATAQGARALAEAGADAIKCGIGNGSICSTRLATGTGVPQFSALQAAAPICKEYNIPLISDGGNRNSGNMCKALAAGAQTIMLGRLIAGSDESPSPLFIKDNKRYKLFRGMASFTANLSNAIKQNTTSPDPIQSHIEGVEAYIPHTGPVSDTLAQLCNNLRSGFSYSGATTLSQFQSKAQFIRITNNGLVESGIHDVLLF